MEAKRILKNVDVQFISLVPAGANQKTILWKSEKASENPTFNKTIQFLKKDEDKRIVYGIVYAPDEIDTDGDTMAADEIEKMAYNFMKGARTNNVDDQHDYIADDGFIAESWLLKSADPMFPDEKTGSWAVGIKVTNDETWEKVKSGEIKGLSLAGVSEYEEVKKDVDVNTEKRETKDSFIKRIMKKVGLSKIDPVESAIEADVMRSILWDGMYSLEDVLNNVLNNRMMGGNSVGIREIMLSAIDNFRQLVEGNLTDEINKQNKEGEMTPDELKTAITEAINPLTEKMESIETEIQTQKDAISELEKSVNERIEKIEKATGGKKGIEGQDAEIEKEKSGFIWTTGMAGELEDVA